MTRRTVARRYAKAIIELAAEAGKLEEVSLQLHSVLDLIGGHADLNSIFGNPAIRPQAKSAIFEELEPHLNLDPICANTIRLLIRKGRIHMLDAIAGEYDERLRELQGKVVARVKTARPLTDTALGDLRRRLEEISGKQVDMQTDVDSELVGGLVARIGDRIYDGSVKHQLERIRRRLVEE